MPSVRLSIAVAFALTVLLFSEVARHHELEIAKSPPPQRGISTASIPVERRRWVTPAHPALAGYPPGETLGCALL